MRTSRTSVLISYLTFSLVSIALPVSSEATASPMQSGLSTTGKPTKEPVLLTKSDVKSPAKNQVLVRNTAIAEPSPKTTTTATVPKSENNKMIGRCWKRLMNMVREVNHAHRDKTNKA